MFENPIESAHESTEYISIKAKQKRNTILNNTVDRVNPIRYANLTAEQQAELVAYRQSLLDVPQQQGFPTDIQWPTKPAWL